MGAIINNQCANSSRSLAAESEVITEHNRLCPDYPAAAKHATALLAMIFGVTHVMILQYLPDGDCLLLLDGIGWPVGLLGQLTFDNGVETFSNFILNSNAPVVIGDLHDEARFKIPDMLMEAGLVSGMGVRISTKQGKAGLLAVFTEKKRQFTNHDLASINAVAGMLSASVKCDVSESGQHNRDPIEQAKQEWETTVDALPHVICLLDEQGRIVRANRSVELWVPGVVRDIRGRTIHEVLHPDCKDQNCYMLTTCADAWESVKDNRHFVFEVNDKILKRKLEIQLRPISTRNSVVSPSARLTVMVMHDISRIKHSEELLRYSNSQLEDLVRDRTNELSQINEQLWCEILERRRIVEELRQSENDMHLLSAQLLTAQEMERKRIAAELHDGISQSLTAIKFTIESGVARGAIRSAGEDTTVIDTIINRIQTAIEEVHQISTNLRPSMLDDLGIIPTIAWFCREFGSIYKNISLETHIEVIEEEVPAPLKTVIYRILQEALNNIVRHAVAKSVVVSLDIQDTNLVFQVKDNGRGFDPNKETQRVRARKGSGLGSMRERTEFSGGTFSMHTRKGAGTSIRAMWPLHGFEDSNQRIESGDV